MSQPPSLSPQQEPPPQPQPTAGPAPAAPAAASAAAAAPPPACRTSPASMPAPACAGWRASSDVDLTKVKGTGEKGRITKEDVLGLPARPAPAPRGRGAPPRAAPASRRSRRRTSPSSARSRPSRCRASSGSPARTCTAPGSTSRTSPSTTRPTSPSSTPTARSSTTPARTKGYRVTLLAFLLKASVSALRQFPEFNARSSPEKDALIYKKYYHIGIAVDTPDGLVVPVLRDVDRKGIVELSQELGAISKKARDGKLQAGRHAGRRASPSPRSAASAAPASRRSSTRPRWRSSAWCARRWRRSGTARSSSRG